MLCLLEHSICCCLPAGPQASLIHVSLWSQHSSCRTTSWLRATSRPNSCQYQIELSALQPLSFASCPVGASGVHLLMPLYGGCAGESACGCQQQAHSHPPCRCPHL